jgi:biopolymer transport protein ExbD
MAFASGGRGRVRSEINVTPLVDVVLVLLIIFMVLTPVLLKQLPITVPERAEAVAAAAPPADGAQLVVRIAADGSLALDGEPLVREALPLRLRSRLAARRDATVFFEADDGANYGEVVEVMDACRGAGATTLGLITSQ